MTVWMEWQVLLLVREVTVFLWPLLHLQYQSKCLSNLFLVVVVVFSFSAHTF